VGKTLNPKTTSYDKIRVQCPVCDFQSYGRIEWRAGLCYPVLKYHCRNCGYQTAQRRPIERTVRLPSKNRKRSKAG
jgi:rubredoxin